MHPPFCYKMAEKTVIILAANVLMRAASGRMLMVDLNTSKGGGGGKGVATGGSTAVASFSKTAWTCSVEAVCEYSRLVFDLFPHQCQVGRTRSSRTS